MQIFIRDHTIIAHPLSDKLSIEEKTSILQQRKLVLSTVKKYIDAHLNPKTNNLHSPTENFYQPDKTINAILQFYKIDITKLYQFQVTVLFRFTLKEILSHAL